MDAIRVQSWASKGNKVQELNSNWVPHRVNVQKALRSKNKTTLIKCESMCKHNRPNPNANPNPSTVVKTKGKDMFSASNGDKILGPRGL